MSKQLYTCGHSLFTSYLCSQLASFVEYKVNVGGCVPETFLPVLRRFDRYCTLHPQDYTCLKPGYQRPLTFWLPRLILKTG